VFLHETGRSLRVAGGSAGGPATKRPAGEQAAA